MLSWIGKLRTWREKDGGGRKKKGYASGESVVGEGVKGGGGETGVGKGEPTVSVVLEEVSSKLLWRFIQTHKPSIHPSPHTPAPIIDFDDGIPPDSPTPSTSQSMVDSAVELGSRRGSSMSLKADGAKTAMAAAVNLESMTQDKKGKAPAMRTDQGQQQQQPQQYQQHRPPLADVTITTRLCNSPVPMADTAAGDGGPPAAAGGGGRARPPNVRRAFTEPLQIAGIGVPSPAPSPVSNTAQIESRPHPPVPPHPKPCPRRFSTPDENSNPTASHKSSSCYHHQHQPEMINIDSFEYIRHPPPPPHLDAFRATASATIPAKKVGKNRWSVVGYRVGGRRDSIFSVFDEDERADEHGSGGKGKMGSGVEVLLRVDAQSGTVSSGRNNHPQQQESTVARGAGGASITVARLAAAIAEASTQQLDPCSSLSASSTSPHRPKRESKESVTEGSDQPRSSNASTITPGGSRPGSRTPSSSRSSIHSITAGGKPPMIRHRSLIDLSTTPPTMVVATTTATGPAADVRRPTAPTTAGPARRTHHLRSSLSSDALQKYRRTASYSSYSPAEARGAVRAGIPIVLPGVYYGSQQRVKDGNRSTASGVNVDEIVSVVDDGDRVHVRQHSMAREV
ncbi:hypothetical protein HK104_009961 [Borealophlyctis nickersoniae]|nr:hypothetical protein HK104_009961 [Borealophlyctis nickersoniae]